MKPHPARSHSQPRTRRIAGLLMRLLQRAGCWWPQLWDPKRHLSRLLRSPSEAAFSLTAGKAALRLETLEPRILMSADLMPATGQVVERTHIAADSVAAQGAQANASTSTFSAGGQLAQTLPGVLLDAIHQQWPTSQTLSQSAQLQVDSGGSATDQITNDPALVVIPAATAQGQLVVQARIGSSAAFQDLAVARGEDGRFAIGTADLSTLNGAVLPDGAYRVDLRLRNDLGATSAATSVAFTLDRSLPNQPAQLALATGSDSGTPGDLLTNATTVTLTGKTEAGATVSLGSAQTTADANGVFSFAALALSEGENLLTVHASDAAGNSASASVTVRRDSSAPSAPASLALAGSSDSGVVGDRLTSAAAVTVVGSAEVGSIVTLGAAQRTADASGTFQFDNVALLEGSNSLTVTATDAAGNVSSVGTLTLTRDSTVPAAPATLALAAASDTGTAGDRLTSAATVTITGSAEAGTVVKLGSAQTTADGAGKFQFDNVALVEGSNALSITATDAAGNIGSAASLTLTRDSSAPVAPTNLALAAASDSGVAGDRITSVAAVTITGTAEAGALVKLGGAQTTADGTGKFQFDNVALVEGSNTLSVTATDAAGNTSSAASLTLMRDSTAPAAPTNLALAAASDTGVVGDGITSASTVSITGSAEAGSIVKLGSAQTTADAGGRFQFDSVALVEGSNTLSITATDAAGNAGAAGTLTLRRVVGLTLGSVRLATDSGSSSSDHITNTVTVLGTITSDQAGYRLLVALDPANASAALTDLSSLLQADGSFSIDRTRLDALAGGSLAEGAHVLRLVAADSNGQQITPQDFAFTLQTTQPTLASLAIAGADALNGDTSQTAAGRVTLRGSLDAGATLSLASQNLSAQAGAGGVLQLPDVALAVGANTLSFTVTDAAGNSATVSKTFTRIEQTRSDQVLTWNDIALKAIQLDVTDPPVATRTLAMQSLAVYDVLAAIEGTPAYVVQRSVGGPVSADVAVAVASHKILSLTYPAQRAQLDAALAASLALVADGAAKDTGIALGLDIANAVWASRQNDGSEAYVIYNGSTATGAWRPTGPNYLLPDEPQWGSVTPFALSSPSEFRPVAPPALDTAAYADAINQVKSLGAANSSTRTTDQTEQAHFWADGKGSYTPPGHWNLIAEDVARAKGNSLSANARLFAQLNVALADAAIACWDSKYTYGAWRPETAIQNADADNNAATVQDASWTPLLITPAHPDYVSGHSTFSAAAAAVLGATFGDATSFTTSSATLLGVSRSFTSFSQAVDEAGMSRIYGGIHTSFANEAGKTLGANVANAVLQRFTLKTDTQAPTIALADSAAVVKAAPTFGGQVFDNLSGVAAVTWQLDSAAAHPLTLQANGSFSLPTTLATDGTADGAHTLKITATDVAGNARTVTRSFTLDTRAPSVTLSSLAEGAALNAASRLSGSASGTGSSIVSLSWQFDDGKARFITYDTASGAFDQALPLGDLAIGAHTLKLTAVDAAGNTSVLSRAVTIQALAPFTVSKVTPAAGSSDVGVTFRPQVYFSRAVNTATLTTSSFYATGPDGAKLDVTLVPASDGSFCWMYFNTSMPSGSQVTLHLNGSAIRAAQDGSFLDADGNGSAGGELTWSFTTVNTSSVLGTRLVGRVVDPGADLEPMTFDDIRRGADGVIHTADDVFLNPIAHAKVYIVGRPDLVTYTDANGNFSFDNVPVGDVKVGVDGRTATNAPTGIFWPEMVMDVLLKPGITNTLMGSMGSTASQQDNADRSEIYLPRVQSSAMTQVSGTDVTKITVNAASAPDLTDAQRAALTLTVNPGTAVGSDGKVLSDVKIGINTVPPELVKDMLPPGVLEHTYDITIQAPGVDTFTEPVQITFPNVFNAAPGTKLNILSFDHTTGRLVINGTATVSADGLTVVSDEGSGVVAPGWHGLTPPFSSLGSGNLVPDVPDYCMDEVPQPLSQAAMVGNEAELLVNNAINDVILPNGYVSRYGVDEVEIYMEPYLAQPGVEDYKGDDFYVLRDPYSGVTFSYGIDLGSSFDVKGQPHDVDVQEFIRVMNRYGQFQEAEINVLVDKLDQFIGLTGSAADSAYDNAVRNKALPNLTSDELNKIERTMLKYNWDLFSSQFKKADQILKYCTGQIPEQMPIEAQRVMFGEAWRMGAGGVKKSPIWKPMLERKWAEALDALKSWTDPSTNPPNEERRSKIKDQLNNLILGEIIRSTPMGNFTPIPGLISQDPFNRQFNYSIPLGNVKNSNLMHQDVVKFGVASSTIDLLNGLYPATGRTYFLMQNLDSGEIVSRGSSFNGKILNQAFNILPGTNYRIWSAGVDGVHYGYADVYAGSAGSSWVMPNIALLETLSGDADRDGLSDVIELIVGTNRTSNDSDQDGVSDSAELAAGIDPLGGLNLSVGTISVATVQGTAEALAMLGATDGTGTATALVAMGTQGLAIVDATSFTKPSILAQLDLTGESVDVVADETRGIAAVAAGNSGLHLVDISRPLSPTLIQTVALGGAVSGVVTRDGIAYAIFGTRVAAVDLNTGDIRQSIDLASLGGGLLSDITIDGSTLYTMDSSRTLRSISINGDLLTPLDSLVLADAGGKITVGGGVAYVGTTRNFSQGFSTVSVANPADITLLSGIDAANVAGESIAATGSGLLVSAGYLRGPRGEQIYALDVLNGTDPADTGTFLNRINLPAAPKDIALANGLAFVADGPGGLQIVNYAAFDTKGVAPTVSIAVQGVDVDATKAGTQVLEGRAVHVVPTVKDDVQVRNVELLVNGKVVSTDVAFPWELTTQVPTIASGGNTMTIQVRATDTGGNSTLSDPVVLDVVPDTFAPQVQTVSVAEAASLYFVRSIDVAFDEPIDLTKLTTAGVHLVRAGTDGVFGTADDVDMAVKLDSRALGQRISVLPTDFLTQGSYRLTIDAAAVSDKAGNALAAPIVRNFSIKPASQVRAGSGSPEIPTAPAANPGQEIGVPVSFDPKTARITFAVIDSSGNKSTRDVAASRWDAAKGIAYIKVPMDAISGDATVFSLVGTTKTVPADGVFPLQIVPVITDVQVSSVAADGSTATVVLTGYGFIEGNNSEYHIGSTSITDTATNGGPDVWYGLPNGVSTINGSVTLTVPLSAGAFGPITVKTAGGTSAAYATSLSGVTAVALSGTPADAAKASANPGQAVTLTGSGLSTATDVLMSYTDDNGNKAVVRLNPSSAAQDGRSATLELPDLANGIVILQVFGSTEQVQVQIVPVIDPSSRTWAQLSQGQTVLGGLGFVEGATRFQFSGAAVVDTQINAGADVSGNGSRVSFDATTLASYGAGALTVTTAGGSSAAVQLNSLRPAVSTGLGDVAVDAAGKLWIADDSNPGHLLQVDPASGQTLKTLTMSSAWGTQYVYDYVGLQVLTSGMTLGSTAVPAGSLLVFNGQPNTDVVVAVDPATGTVLASLTLAANHDLRAGLYDAASGHLFVLSNTSNQLVEIDATNGASLSSHTLTVNVQNTAGLAIDPTNGNLWVASANAGNQLVQVTKAGVEVRRYDVSSPEVGWVSGWQISGLAFGIDGKLWMSTSAGLVLQVDVNADPATRSATLSSVVGAARNGTAAQAGVASTNVGDVIELRGSNFGAGTEVLFQVRSIEGVVSTVAVAPLLIDASGTRLQVKVPDLATTGDVRVANTGNRDLGFSSYNDAIYRQVTRTFTAGSDTAVIRFADGGLEGLSNESWGLDNVRVSQGSTVLFSDDFESGAKANWSDATVDASETANFSRFSGRFSNGSQSLSLSGLTAGQTYTLSFDLYAIDSWDGQGNVGYGPDEFDVSVDGVNVLRENLSNYSMNDVQTLNASAGVRLQIVPTLTGLSAVTGPGSSLTGYTLTGSGFMEGASTIRVGGVDYTDAASNQGAFNVTGSNSSYGAVVTPGSLDGPIRISTEGGWAELPNTAASWGAQPVVAVTGLSVSAGLGQPANPAQASANTGQTLVFTGQGFTDSTLVQFSAEDASGQVGSVTVVGSANNSGTTLSVIVPVNARSGSVSVLGSGVSQQLQIVPTITAMGGTVATGNTLLLEGTGLTASDLQVQIDGRGVGSFQVRTVNVGSGSNPDQQLLSLTVPAGVSAGRITVSTAGGLMVYQAGASTTSDAALTPAADAGDSLATAQAITVLADHQVSLGSSIGDGAQTTKDVDLYKIELDAGDTLSLTMSGLAGRVRIFDASGTPLAAQTYAAAANSTVLQWVAPTGGTYYLGVSGSSNSAYNPASAGSGAASSTGSYVLGVARLGAGSSRLSGITASATSGTPAQAGVASANTGQSITVKGVGLVAGDKVVFTSVDSSGNLGEVSVTPTSIDIVNQTLTVVVPTNATTGHVRLARDQAGLLLQIVPTLSDLSMPVNGNFAGGTLTLVGSGFADGATAVQFGSVRIDDVSQSAGLTVNNNNSTGATLSMTVPDGVPIGPIRIITAGGTSAAFGLSVTGLSGSANSGTAAGTAASANPGQAITLTGSGFDTSLDVVFQVIDTSGTRDEVVVRPSTVSADGTQAQVVVPMNAITGVVRVVGDRNSQVLSLQIVPVVSDVQVQSVASDGSTATVVITGYGFVEGHNSEYRFGAGANAQVFIDAGANTGADVYYGSPNGVSTVNGSVTLTVPLSAGAFGPITVKTAGGTSAVYATSLSGVTAVALSGTPADAAKASANPGQAITLTGSALSTATDVLMAYTDYNGSRVMVKVNPSTAAADGTSATLVLPEDVNGVLTLQVFGSSSQPQLQIVPVLKSWDYNGQLVLLGAGFAEGATRYDLGGVNVNDTQTNAGADVGFWYDGTRGVTVHNGWAQLDATTLPNFGVGTVKVTTAGGTSSAMSVNVMRINTGGEGLGDVAVDAAGQLWVIDSSSPARLLKVDPSSGQVLQTITAVAAWGGTYANNYAGLQVLGTAMTLGGTSVPAGSLLVVNGQPNPDQVVAVNPETGAVVARLDLTAISGLDLTSGMYDAASGHLFGLWYSKNQLVEIDPSTGNLIGSYALPVSITTSAAGVVADPASGNLWVGSTATSGQIVEVTKKGVEVRRVDLAAQGINQNEISGLAFAADGKLWVSSIQGVVYKVAV